MTTRTGVAPTVNAGRYLQQLCKHWSHKFSVEFSATEGVIRLPMGDVRLLATPESLAVTLFPKPDADFMRMQAVVEDHLNRFAFREAPLPLAWHDQTT